MRKLACRYLTRPRVLWGMLFVHRSALRKLLVLLFAVLMSAPLVPAQQPNTQAQSQIATYIHNSWDALTRSLTSCSTLLDSKVTTVPILYLPASLPVPAEVARAQQLCHIQVRHLPRTLHHLAELDPRTLPRPGLLYLPHPYVVPGGRFNEMYGWDSYFILLGLIRDGRTDLARGMVENFFFEIENYGALLNANRTYFLTRSQPPFLSSMIREVYEHPGSLGKPDKAWLLHAYRLAVTDHALWMSAPHVAGATGLARYNDLGAGPVPEMDDDSTYYSDVIRWLLAHRDQHPEYLLRAPMHPTPAEAANLNKSSCDLAQHTCANARVTVSAGGVSSDYRLTSTFFHGDRAMRESGFDTTFRFGPFSGSTDHFAPVCLNALLYKYEQDLALIAGQLGLPVEAQRWLKMAEARHKAIDRYLWNRAAGLYFDYDYTTGKQSTYRYLTAFYPLWAGAASSQQASAVAGHIGEFAHQGGLAMSTNTSTTQWDLPYGWAPVTWLAIDGLHRTGHDSEALPLAARFSSTVLDNFKRDGTIREKYNVVSGTANIEVSAGYKSNVVGFGWTNATYMLLRDLLARQ